MTRRWESQACWSSCQDPIGEGESYLQVSRIPNVIPIVVARSPNVVPKTSLWCKSFRISQCGDWIACANRGQVDCSFLSWCLDPPKWWLIELSWCQTFQTSQCGGWGGCRHVGNFNIHIESLAVLNFNYRLTCRIWPLTLASMFKLQTNNCLSHNVYNSPCTATTCIEEFRWFVWRQRPCTATLATKSLVGLSEDNEQYQKKTSFPNIISAWSSIRFYFTNRWNRFF